MSSCQTTQALQQLRAERGATRPETCVFTAANCEAMTRFGIYERVRRLVGNLDGQQSGPRPARRIAPNVFRHITAVHLLKAGVQVSVIRGLLGHVSLETIDRYAAITLRMKQHALSLCKPLTSKAPKRKPVWHDDAEWVMWLASL